MRPEPRPARAGGLDRLFAAKANFAEAVMKGLASRDRGEGLTHKDVGERIETDVFGLDGGQVVS